MSATANERKAARIAVSKPSPGSMSGKARKLGQGSGVPLDTLRSLPKRAGASHALAEADAQPHTSETLPSKDILA